MDKKLYHRGDGEVVKFIYDWTFEKNALAVDTLAPCYDIYAYCDPSLPVGWIEGEEVYQVRIRKSMDWLNAQKEIYDKWLTDGAKEDLRRIWIEPYPERGIVINDGAGFVTQSDQFREAPIWYTKDEMYRWLVRNNYSKEIATELSQKWADDLQGAFAKGFDKAVREARQQSEGEKLREELEMYKRNCSHCKKETLQSVKFYNPHYPEQGEVWVCSVCKENTDWVTT